MFLRIREAERDVWEKLVNDPGMPFKCALLIDGDVQPGDAYIEIDGARINIGQSARIAIVRAALGYELTKEQVQLTQFPGAHTVADFQNLNLVQELPIDNSDALKDS